jgi:hypothetical protein
LDGFFAAMRQNQIAGRAAVEAAVPALDRLCEVMRGRSGQPYKVRALLYSLWNGQPTRLNEVLSLDRNIREDFCAVLLAFGYCDREVEFFYDAVTAALKKVGQYEWFIEAHEEKEAA